jgi:hypothetical protein
VVYVTTNKPYASIVALLPKKRKIATDRLFFIDCVACRGGTCPSHEPQNCMVLQSPRSLTELGIAISKATAGIPGKKALLFDSLSTLLLYNDAEVVGRFFNYLINRMKAEGIDTYIFALRTDADADIIKNVSLVADRVERKGD